MTGVLQLAQRPQRRGAEVFAQQLARELRRRGHPSAVLFLYPCDDAVPLRLDSGDAVLTRSERPRLERWLGLDPRLLQSLRRELRRRRPHVVQLNGGRSVKYGALARRLDGPRYRVVYRNIGNPADWLPGPVHRFAYRRLFLPAVDGVVGVSTTTLEAVRSVYGITKPMVEIPRAVDPGQLQPVRERDVVRRELETPGEAAVVLFVGSLAPEKRLDRIVRVVSRLLESAWLWIAGDGPERAATAALAESLGISERVRLLGGREDVADLLHAADVLVLLSDTEGLPGVVLEAGACGLPAVASRVGGVAECVLDGESGFLVEPNDEDAAVDRLERLLADRELRRRLGERSRALVAERFSLASAGERYLAFYDSLRGAGEGVEKLETTETPEQAVTRDTRSRARR